MVLGVTLLTTVGIAQIGQIIKVVGVGAAVKQFGPDINRAINRLANYKESPQFTTKVVPIFSGGVDSRKAIGAAQVMGPRAAVNKVQGVLQLEQPLFGREIEISAMIPVDNINITRVSRVDGVGVSGIVDLRL